MGFETKWIEFENVERVAGESKWPFRKLLLYSIDGIVAFSTMPLAIASVVGLLMFVLAIIFIIFIVVRTLLFKDPVAGWPSMICIITPSAASSSSCIGIPGILCPRPTWKPRGGRFI